MTIIEDVINKSVTADDVMDYQGKGVVNFVMPYFWATPRIFSLPTDLPSYWSYQRDVVLRNTILYESYWAGAVAIAINKVASQSFDVKGDAPRRVVDAQELVVQWGGESYVQGMSKLMADFFTTDNGAFVEIVRQSSAAGSKIIGMLHLDSLRCQRTGDPEIPLLFRDLKGGLHELRDYQVMEFTDMPDPGYSWLGVGHCAAERAYDQIYKVAGMTRTLNEKITGAGAHQLAFLQGISQKQMGELITTAQNEAASKGLLYYLGTILAAIQGDLPVDIKTLQLRGLPENFDQKVTLDLALLAYANSLGLVLTDLQPLSGQGLGTGAQSIVLEEKAQGRTIATFRKMFTHKVNEWIMPDKTTFAFKERDLHDEQQQADVALAREQVRASMVTTGEVTAQEARQMAVDSDDLPKEFIAVDTTGGEALGDEERGDTTEMAVTGAATTIAPGAPVAEKPAQPQGETAAKEAQEVDALWALRDEIASTRRVLLSTFTHKELGDLGYSDDDIAVLSEWIAVDEKAKKTRGKADEEEGGKKGGGSAGGFGTARSRKYFFANIVRGGGGKGGRAKPAPGGAGGAEKKVAPEPSKKSRSEIVSERLDAVKKDPAYIRKIEAEKEVEDLRGEYNSIYDDLGKRGYSADAAHMQDYNRRVDDAIRVRDKIKEKNAEIDMLNNDLRGKYADALSVDNPAKISASYVSIGKDRKKGFEDMRGNMQKVISADKFADTGSVIVDGRRGARANYQRGFTVDANGNRINTGRINIKVGGASVLAHEYGHHIETLPGVHETAMEFYNRRTAGERAVHMGPGYGRSEVTKKDKFIHPYMGKVYPNATEIISMGMQHLMDDPISLRDKDKDFFDFMIGVIQ